MNLRKITLEYLSWCPGVESAARFIPDRDISKTMFISGIVILLTGSMIAFYGTRIHAGWVPEKEEGPVEELPVEWFASFGGSEDDIGEHVQATSDGGYLVCGYTCSYGVEGSDVYLLKVNPDGTLDLNRTYGDVGWDAGRHVIETDGGYLVTGYTDEDLLLMKVNHIGELLWSRTYEGCLGYSVEETGDGCYAIAGVSGDDALLMKTDSDGDVLWSRVYGGPGEQQAWALKVTEEGGYIIGGITRQNGGHWDFYVLKTDSLGEAEWSKTLGGSKGDWLYSVLEAPDGGVVCSGYRVSVNLGGGSGGSSTWLVKLDRDGETVWSKTYPGSCGYSVQGTGDGGYVVLSRLGGDVLLLKIDEGGDIQWSKTYGGPIGEMGNCIQLTEDGGFIITGSHELKMRNDKNILLLKVPKI